MKNKFIIQLKNLPEQGLDLVFDKKNSAQLSSKLQDLIGNNDYKINLEIRVTGDFNYRIEGSIQSQLNLLCSRCAYEFQYPIDKKILEDIYIQTDPQRKDRESRINHYSEQSQDENFTILNNTLLYLDNFLYELLAVEEPARPIPYPECDKNDNCKHLQNLQNKDIFHKEKNTTLENKLKNLLKN